MLKNAFNAEEETEKDWDLELRDDVKGEVESKYGKVSEIFVVKESLVCFIFLSHPKSFPLHSSLPFLFQCRFEELDSSSPPSSLTILTNY